MLTAVRLSVANNLQQTSSMKRPSRISSATLGGAFSFFSLISQYR
jgi:hypothetical protein